MSDTIDLNCLSKEQLIAMVQVRTQALEMNHHADEVLMEKMGAGLTADDMQKYIDAKNRIVTGLVQADMQIMGKTAPLAN